MRTDAYDFRLRFGCNTCVKVFTLNWDRTHGIYVQICRTRCYDLHKIFEEHICVIVFARGTHSAGILINAKGPKHYFQIYHIRVALRFDFNHMSKKKILKTLLTFHQSRLISTSSFIFKQSLCFIMSKYFSYPNVLDFFINDVIVFHIFDVLPSVNITIHW